MSSLKWDKYLPKKINDLFAVADGHDHDGVNSKAVTVGTVADGAITVGKLGDNAIAASAAGRGKMQNGFFDVASVLAKFAANSFTTANVKALFASNSFLADADTRAKFQDGIFPPEKLTAIANLKTLSYQVEDLGAGADITTRAIFEAPAGAVITLTAAKIISQGTAAGIDAGNTCKIDLLAGTDEIASETYDDGTAFPAENASGSLGALDATHKILAAGEKLHIVVTNGATANPPAFMIQIEYTIATA